MSQRLFYFLIVGWIGLSFSGCAPKAQVTTNNRSSDQSSTVDDSQYKLAECNRINVPGMTLLGQISTYYSAGRLIASYLNVNLTGIPSELRTSSTHFMQIFRWAEQINGQPTTNSVPVIMYFINKTSGAVANPNGSDRISKSTIESIISSNNLSASGITLANFFDRHYVILTGMDIQWDAARFVLYNGTTIVNSGSVLLPAFYSNPNVYIRANAAVSLQQLHPNFALKDSNGTEAEYYALTEQICSGFFGSTRTPASLGGAPALPLPAAEVPPLGFFELVTRFLHNFFSL